MTGATEDYGDPRAVPFLDFRRRVQLYRDDWRRVSRWCRFEGACVLCGRRTFGFDDGQDDPRGPLGDHAAAPLDPTDYGATGAIVPACFLCQNDTEDRYTRLLRRAERIGGWQYAEPAEPASECFGCGAPIRLAGVDGGPYRGWTHTGPPTFSRVNPRSAPYPEHEHAAYPRNAARVECRARVHHFSGSWCPTCGGWA